MSEEDAAKLRRLLVDRFDLSELKDLALDLSFYDLTDLSQRKDLARDLILKLEQRGQLKRLVEWIGSNRPDIDLELYLGKNTSKEGGFVANHVTRDRSGIPSNRYLILPLVGTITIITMLVISYRQLATPQELSRQPEQVATERSIGSALATATPSLAALASPSLLVTVTHQPLPPASTPLSQPSLSSPVLTATPPQAFSTSVPTAQSILPLPTPVQFGPITVCANSEFRDNRCQVSDNVLPSNVEKLYATWTYQGPDIDIKYIRVWYRNGEEISTFYQGTLANDGMTYLVAVETKLKTKYFLPGSYRVEFYVKGRLVHQGIFVVK